MNDAEIRTYLHQNLLQKFHSDAQTLVIDELGLRHGKHRADIAVVNGHLIGYEIKSDEDNLTRLTGQIEAYNAVFDYICLIVTEKHVKEAMKHIPCWWGIIIVSRTQCGKMFFRFVRKMRKNKKIDNFAVVQLLWRQEVIELLSTRVPEEEIRRERRANLYKKLLENFRSMKLRYCVRECLKKRENWRSY